MCRTGGILILSNSKFTTRGFLPSALLAGFLPEWFMFLLFMFTLLEDDVFVGFVVFFLHPTFFRWRKLPLMFNSCHVTRLRRTSDLLLRRRLLLVRLHRGRCHELYKHVPRSRGKAAAGTVALEFGDLRRG